MPIKLSLKEALDRQASAKAESPKSSASPTHRLLLKADDLDRPVGLVKALIGLGLTLKRAHSVVDKLTSGETVAVEVATNDVQSATALLGKFGLSGHVAQIGSVDPKRIREKQKLSQSEFAVLYGLDERTLQNWEQHRNEPDTPARVLLTLIEKNPKLVVHTLYENAERTAAPDPARFYCTRTYVGAMGPFTNCDVLSTQDLFGYTGTAHTIDAVLATHGVEESVSARSEPLTGYRRDWAVSISTSNHSWIVASELRKSRA